MDFILTLAIRLLLACVLGGIIGYERENMHRPAGFRTHILVCVGSSLVMLTSEYIFHTYRGLTTMDPARLGAQVITGVGFLGAGTIIREGFNVKGLTTAASLWAVSCVGLAVGIGFYEGAVTATILIYLTLIMLKKLELSFARKDRYRVLHIKTENKPGCIAIIGEVLDRHGITVKSLEFENTPKGDETLIRVLIRVAHDEKMTDFLNELQGVDGIIKVYEK